MPNPLIIALAILPGIFLAWWMMRQDKYERENRWHLLIAFGIGMLITVPAMWLETWLANFGFDDPAHFGKILFFAFIGVALVEEALKAIGVLIFPFFQPFFNEPIDGIVYTVMVGLGFATLENVLYADRFGLETVILRAFTAVPAHAAFSVIMGFFIGKAKMETSQKRWLLF
ncbi:MAG: PrsW family glutamic-type intramembrane protease, partial [Bacteroidota bacterium]